MPRESTTQKELLAENEDLRARLDEAEETLRAIRNGEVDGFVVSGVDSEEILTLEGADRAYRVLIEKMNEGALTLTAEGMILYANRRFAEMLRIPLEKVIGSVIHTWIAPDGQREILQSLMRKGVDKDRRGQLVLAAIDGTLVPVSLSVCNLSDNGRPDCFGLVATDLTKQKRNDAIAASEKLAQELLAASRQSRVVLLSMIEDQKRAAEALQASEAQVRLLLDSTAEAIHGLDLKGRCTFCNPACLQLLGYEHPDQLLGRNMHDLIHHTRADGMKYPMEGCRIDAAFQRGEGAHADDEVFWRADGTSFPSEYWSYPIRRDGKVVGSVVTFVDITERRRAENTLCETNARHSAMIENIGDVIGIVGADGMTKYQSPNVEKWFGWKPEDLVGKNGFDRIHPEDIERMQEEHSKVLEEEAARTVEYRYKCKDGNYKWIELSAINRINEPAINGVLLNYHDITERKQAAEKLIESEEKYRGLIENIEEIVYFTDTAGKIVHISPQVSRYGYTPDDLLSLGSFVEIVFSADVERVVSEYEHAITTGEVNPSEYRILDHWGEVHWVETRSRIVRDASGSIIGNTGVLRDIGERKQAEEDLQRSELKYRNQASFLDLVIENSPFAMQVMDSKGVIVRVNQALRAIMHLTDDMIVGKYNVLHDRNIDEQELMPVVEAVFNDLKSTRFVMFWTGSKAGDVDLSIADDHWIDVSMFPITNEAGKLVNVVCQYVDITDRKQTEEELRESTMKLREAQEMAHLGFWSQNVKSGKVEWSDEVFEILGLDPDTFTPQIDSILALSWWPDGDGQSRLDEITNHAIQKHTPGHYEQRFRRPDNSVGYYYSTFQGKFDENGELDSIVGTVLDITERRRAEEEREALRAQVIQSQKLESIGILAGGVAHEINNPINGIMNYAQLIKDKMEPESREQEFASEIIVETERVATIVRSLLTFSRQDKEGHSPARMIDVVEGTTSLIQTIMLRDQITLEVDVPADLPNVNCRTQQIQQVIMNLMTNGRDALNQRYKDYDENKILRISARSVETDDRTWVRTTVEDHGAGISVEIEEHLFDPFFTTKNRTEGTGLGLSISHGIVLDHNGRLTFESEPGEFTRFHLDLPVDSG